MPQGEQLLTMVRGGHVLLALLTPVVWIQVALSRQSSADLTGPAHLAALVVVPLAEVMAWAIWSAVRESKDD